MRITRYIAFIILLFVFCTNLVHAAIPSTSSSMVIQISPGSGSLDLSSTDHTSALRQASTPVRVTVTVVTPGMPHRVAVYACVNTDEAMRLSGKASTLTTANLRIRNAQGEWAMLEPLTELGGRRGVRIAVVNGTSAEILLQVQLQVLASQAPGTYQGVLMLLAQEQ